jgi:hypothetical protein
MHGEFWTWILGPIGFCFLSNRILLRFSIHGVSTSLMECQWSHGTARANKSVLQGRFLFSLRKKHSWIALFPYLENKNIDYSKEIAVCDYKKNSCLLKYIPFFLKKEKLMLLSPFPMDKWCMLQATLGQWCYILHGK